MCDVNQSTVSAVSQSAILNSVKKFYGNQLTCTDDINTSACANSGTSSSAQIQAAMTMVHPDVTKRFFGCGVVIPEKLAGMNVLDLGSGSGRDCFAISKLVGQDGHVTGIDMTDEQLDIAGQYIGYHTEQFGYSKQNVRFVKGYIEKLSEAGIEPGSMDVIVSNCVLCLSPDKRAFLKEAFKALKVGGELYFSSMFADRILSDDLLKHDVLWGEGLSGALWWEELYNIAEGLGFTAPRLVTAVPITINREDFRKMTGEARYVSATYRLFKLPEKHAGPTLATYKGGVTGCPEVLVFDHQTRFEKVNPFTLKGKPCGLKKKRECPA